MLLHLYIENLILIDRLEIDINDGLNIISGETGSGKSIIFDAINFVIGDKFNKDIIRTGKEKTVVKAVFMIDSDAQKDKLLDYGIDLEDDTVIVERDMNLNNRSSCRINGRPTSLNVIKDLRKLMIDVHNQHEHQGLLDESSHIEFLDNFIGDPIKLLKKECSSTYWDLKSTEQEIYKIEQDAKERERNIDLFKYEIDEIDNADLKIGEEEDLVNRKNILSNSQKIYDVLNESYVKLDQPEGYAESIIDSLRQIVSNLNSISSIDKKLEDLSKSVEDAFYLLEENKSNIRSYIDSIEFDENSLEYVIDRIDIINKLKRKYGQSIEEILSYRDTINNKLSKLLNFNEEVEELNIKKDKLKNGLEEICEKINSIRQHQSSELERAIKTQLDELDMKNIEFKVTIEKCEATPKGYDKVEFMISTNVGEPLRSLSKIVSGGELSRIMLAMKIVLSKVDAVSTLLFDEIDSGISGKAAWAVAQKMAILAKQKQILCITHLPQIASMADQHVVVEKVVKENNTFSNIKKLTSVNQTQEIARLLDGLNYNSMSINHADQMIKSSQEFKAKIN